MSTTTDFYLAQAAGCARDAAATDLPNVKERCLRAEAAWRTMADRAIRGDEIRKELIEAKARSGA